MKIWRFSDPSDHRFARAGRTGGTWQEGEYEVRTRPLVLEWEPGSDVVGDFTWPGLDTDIVVTIAVGQVLQDADVAGFELRPVAMQENSEPAQRQSKKPSVRLPYAGPQLRDLWVTTWTKINRDRSTVTEVRTKDGASSFDATGIQRREKTWDQQRRELVTVLHPRVEGAGLVVPHIQGIFRVREFPGWVFCTDDVKRLIEDHHFTNVSFLEMGDSP